MRKANCIVSYRDNPALLSVCLSLAAEKLQDCLKSAVLNESKQ